MRLALLAVIAPSIARLPPAVAGKVAADVQHPGRGKCYRATIQACRAGVDSAFHCERAARCGGKAVNRTERSGNIDGAAGQCGDAGVDCTLNREQTRCGCCDTGPGGERAGDTDEGTGQRGGTGVDHAFYRERAGCGSGDAGAGVESARDVYRCAGQRGRAGIDCALYGERATCCRRGAGAGVEEAVNAGSSRRSAGHCPHPLFQKERTHYSRLP